MAVDSTALERLKQAVESRTGHDLVEWAEAEEGGIDGVLDRIFEGIPDAFKPEKAGREQATLQYLISVPDGVREYFIHIDQGTCTTGKGTVDEPRATLRIAFPDFLRIITGKLAGMQAFLTGKVKVKGDMLFITRFEGWFEPA